MGQQHAMVALLLVGFFGRQALGLALVQSSFPTDQIPGQVATSLVLSQSLAEPPLAEAKRLYEEVNQLYAQGRYNEALNLAKQALRILEQVLPSNNPNIPHAFEQVARLLSWLDRHDEADTYYSIARLLKNGGTATPIQPEQRPQLPNSIIGQLDARSLQADRRDYLELQDPLLSNQSLSQMPRLPLTGGYFNIHQFDGVAGQTVNLAVTSDDLDDLLILVFSGQSGFLAAASGQSTQFALPLEDAGFYQVTVGSRTPGRTGSYRLWWGGTNGSSETSVFAYRGEHNRIPRDVGDSFNSLFAIAVPRLEGRIEALRAELGDRHPQLAEPLISLAVFYTQLERWTDAESAYVQALDILQAQSNPNLQHLIWAIDGAALMAYRRGDWEQAATLYQAALTRERVALENLIPQGGENAFMARRAIASWLNALAGIYQQQQRYDEAETLLVEMLEIVQDLGKSSEQVAFLQSVANFYRTQGRHDKADPLLEQMLDTIRGLDEPSEQALLLESLANDYRAEGRYDKAEALYRESIDIQETVSGRDRANNPSSLHDLALAYHIQGRYAEAERAYRQALTAAETIYRDEQQAFWVSIFYNLAGLYQAQKRIPAALEVLEEGIDLEQQQFDRNLATLNEAARQRYAASVANTLNHAISLHLNTAPDNNDAAQVAATTLLRRKGRVLEAGLTTLELLERNPSPEDRRLLTELDRLRRQAAEFSFGDAVLSPQTSAQLRSLRSKIENIEAILARRSAALVVETPPVELADVQSRLPANGALVEYVRYRPFDPINPLSGNWLTRGFGNPRYAAYVLLPSGELRWADLGDATQIDGQIQRFLEVMRCGERQASPCYTPERLKPVAQALYRAIFAPLQTHLGKATHLLISPDSQLNLLPFAALVDSQNRYLIESYTLTHLTSGRDLLRLQHSVPSQQPPVVLANPNFDIADVRESLRIASTSRGGVRSPDMTNLRFDPLEGSALEVAAIQPLLGKDAVVLTEAEATENALKQVQGPSILHLATHGFFLEDMPNLGVEELPQVPLRVENPLLRSGLALAGFNQRDSDGEDGVLTALEVSGLNLRGTRLVVLSACETGLGDVADGEGVYGLRRAFVMAGAQSQLMSLWQVSDRRTADLMQQYYERLRQGEGRSEALRQVQLKALENPADRHPYYWAAFFLSGQWTPMDRL